MALIDSDSIRPEPDIPDMCLPAEITLKGEEFDRVVAVADMVDDSITFAVETHGDATVEYMLAPRSVSN